MAKKTIEKFYSDLSDEEISSDYSPLSFSFDGVAFEVDLTAAEKSEFQATIQKYIDVARSVSKSQRAVRRTASASDAKTIRAWAESNGVPVPARGRIPAEVREQYAASSR